ncbi:MAG: response regulator [Nitrospirales bacterium]|nr:response regulator [Nitrospirales bacterium]
MAMDFASTLFPSVHVSKAIQEEIPHNRPLGKKIMIVDDDDDFRMLLCHRLERKGIKCFEAENGEVAKSQLKKTHVDLVITDYRMPKIDGLELIEWLHNNQEHVPIIFVSGDLSFPIREKAAQARVCAVFSKPCSLSDISYKAEEILGKL